MKNMMDDYSNFFEEIKRFKQKQQKQKQRGLNDYNLLTTVLKPHDEVRLHSRMIGSLINPSGSHYQNTLFLEKFLKILNLNNFDFDVNNAKLQLEYKHIDLYLCDGNKHIIIENKVYAGDQPSQIKGYIKNILEESSNISAENIYVIYLSIDRDKPSDYSLGKEKDTDTEYFEVANDLLKYKGSDKWLKNKSFKYKSIHYNKTILKWLKECQNEIQNITNLNEAIKQYINVIHIINNNYEGKVMSLKNRLLNNEQEFKLAEEISNAYVEVKNDKNNQIKDRYLEKIKEKLDGTLKFEVLKWKAIDIISNYYVRIIAQNDCYLIQVTDAKQPFEILDKDLKQNVLQQLKNIDFRFFSSYNKIFGAIEISYSSLDLGSLKKLIIKLKEL